MGILADTYINEHEPTRIISIILFLFISLIHTIITIWISSSFEHWKDTVKFLSSSVVLHKEYKRNKDNSKTESMTIIKDYLNKIVGPYMTSSNLDILYNNIKMCDQSSKNMPIPIRSNGKLTSIDLRHLIWNIGERLGWSGDKRAKFIKHCFPIEMADAEVETIRRNLRQRATCRIELDIPDNGNISFHSLNQKD